MVRPRAPAGIFAAQLCRRPSLGPGWTSGVSAHGHGCQQRRRQATYWQGAMVGEDAVLLPRQNAASHRASQSTELLATTRLCSHLSISALHRLDMHQRFLRIYILTASAPECLCCAVLCEMVTMDRSTAPSQFSIAVYSHVAFPNHLSISSASASAHCSGSDLLKWQQAESTLGDEQYGHACTPPHPPKTRMNAVDGRSAAIRV